MRSSSLASTLVICGAAIAAVLVPSLGHAQASPPPPPAQAPPAANPHVFSGKITAALSVESGRTELNGMQVAFSGQRPYRRDSLVMVSLAYTYATTITPGQSARVTVADRLAASFDVSQNFGERWVMILRSQALRDPIAQINYRLGEMGGFGVRLEKKRVKLRVVPGLALMTDDRNIAPNEDGPDVQVGLYEDVSATISPAWTFTQYVSASRNISNARNHIVSFDARLTGAVTKHLAIQVSYQYEYEQLQPPGVNPMYQKTLVGVQVRF